MGTRQVTVTYGLDIDEGAIADALPADPTDEQIAEEIAFDIRTAMDETTTDRHHAKWDRAALVASVRAELERRNRETAEQGGEET